jgi:class 3 adenylate cyclase
MLQIGLLETAYSERVPRKSLFRNGLQPYCAKVHHVFDIDSDMRSSINTGLVVVGEFQGGSATEYTAMGDAVIVAARMKRLAEHQVLLEGVLMAV